MAASLTWGPAAGVGATLGASALALACGAGAGSRAEQLLSADARPAYSLLSETGLYSGAGGDLAASPLVAGVLAFEPAFPLWSDGADKRRWIRLPEAEPVDTGDMDRWQLPVGTRVWKEFSLAGVPLETRLIERYGSGRDDYWMGAFVWREDRSDATFVEPGEVDVLGTAHDAPASEACLACHNGEPGRILGFSALQLGSIPFAGDGVATGDAQDRWTLARLADEDRLSVPPAPGQTFFPPGDGEAQRALGYLHANCGHCHNPRGTSWPDTQMLLRLGIESASPEETPLYRSVVGQPLQYYRGEGGVLRVAPGDPGASALIARMQVRGPQEQMPPLGTEAVDDVGVQLVSRWIEGLRE